MSPEERQLEKKKKEELHRNAYEITHNVDTAARITKKNR